MNQASTYSHWRQIRQQVFERDNHTCQGCGCIDKRLHTHHIIPVSKGGTDDLDNLITYCNECHSAAEHPSKGKSKNYSPGTVTTLIKPYRFESLRTIVPKSIVNQWRLNPGDQFDWNWEVINGKMVLMVNKVVTSKKK